MIPDGRPKIPRSLPALRELIKGWNTDALRRGDEAAISARWSYTYRPADNPDDLKEISVAEFEAIPGSDNGHPRAGEYSAIAKDDAGAVLFEESGEWLPDMGGIERPEESREGIPGLLLAVTKAAAATVNNAETAESKAMRRLAQAEAREEAKDKKLTAALDLVEELRTSVRAATQAKQAAEAATAEANLQRDAAIADKEEIIKTGGELAEPISAFVMSAYRVMCDHLGETPIAYESELQEKAVNESLNQVGEFLLLERVELPICEQYPALPDGSPRTALLGLLLHHHYRLPWPPLRILIHTSFGVFLMDPPPIDWAPPAQGEPEAAGDPGAAAQPGEGGARP